MSVSPPSQPDNAPFYVTLTFPTTEGTSPAFIAPPGPFTWTNNSPAGLATIATDSTGVYAMITPTGAPEQFSTLTGTLTFVVSTDGDTTTATFVVTLTAEGQPVAPLSSATFTISNTAPAGITFGTPA